MKTFLAVVGLSLLVACDQTSRTQANNNIETDIDATTQSTRYTCPMHPHYISTDADGSCPICGMDLVPVDDSAEDATGDGTIAVSAAMIQTMGVRTEPAASVDFGRSLRAFGTVESNERLENVNVSRVEGWIEDLRVRTEGDTVVPGALLYRVYSPDLIAAQKDYLSSLSIGNDKRIAAVQQRLRSLGMQSAAVEQLNKTQAVIERVPVYAESGGVVAALQVREGDYIKPGTPVLRLQSYADVWIIARIPEQDLALIDTGMPVRLAFASTQGAPTQGIINYVYPTIDPKTRTGEVRIEVDNSLGFLRPGAYADISLDLGRATRLSVPTESVLRDSRGAHVVVAIGDGRFAGRKVELGISAKGRTEILNGLKSGELVVASGQFLLDSEIKLSEGFSMLAGGGNNSAASNLSVTQGNINPAQLAEIDHFTDMTLYLHEALTEQYTIVPSYLDPAIQLGRRLSSRVSNTRLRGVVSNATAALEAAKLAENSDALKLALSELMAALTPWLLEGAPSHYQEAGLTLFREIDGGRYWLQEDGVAMNPYGDVASTVVAWPSDRSSLFNDDEPHEARATDSHAGHR